MQRRFFRCLSRKSSKKYRHYPILDRESYAAHPNIKLHHFGKGEIVHYKEPHHIQDLPDEFRQNMLGTVHYPQPFVLEIQEGKLRGRHAVAFTPDDKIILDSILNHESYIENSSIGLVHYPQNLAQAIRQITLKRSYHIVFSLVNQFSIGFFHWILECLPRLWLLKQYEALVGQTIPVLIDPNPPAYIRETLHMMGITEIIEWDVTFARVKHLLIPMALHGTGRPSGFATAWVHDALLAYLGDDSPHFEAPKIYISRESANKRRVMNEAEVFDFLRSCGFELFNLERMTIAEQIALFTQANVILGPHGAGFANAIHSSEARLLEFFEPSYVNACFYRLANVRNFDYGFFLAESDGLNMRVGIESLESMMQQMELL
jgi:hypothetical protein